MTSERRYKQPVFHTLNQKGLELHFTEIRAMSKDYLVTENTDKSQMGVTTNSDFFVVGWLVCWLVECLSIVKGVLSFIYLFKEVLLKVLQNKTIRYR